MTPSSLKDRLANINSLEESLEELYSIFNSVKDCTLPLIIVDLEVGSCVFRLRLNTEGEEFKTIHEISYPPTEFTKYGRANISGHPMFYGCTFGLDQTTVDPRVVTLLETSEFVKNDINSGIERSTFTKWDVIKKLQLLALPFSHNYKRAIADIMYIQNEWSKEIKKVDMNQDALELVEFMSDEIARDCCGDTDYFKISNFVYFLLYLNQNTSIFDGIIYPSAPAEGEGYNVVLKPESVDKKLKFSSALLCYLIKNKKQEQLCSVKHSLAKV